MQPQVDGSIELTGTIAFGDVLRFQYAQCYRRTWWIVLLLMFFSFVGFLLALTVAILTPTHDFARVGGIWFALLSVYWILLGTAPYRGAKKQMKTNTPLAAPIQYIFSSQGVHRSGVHFSSDISYEALWAVRETKSMFLLYLSASSAFVLPKRFFKDDSQHNEWRIFVTRQISPKAITSSGFLGRWL
jgi:hypothetical protein